MGALVIEVVTAKLAGAEAPVTVRATDRLALHQGHNPHIIPLLRHVFAAGSAPALVSANVEFVLDGAAYSWRSDFDLNSCELTNRSTNLTVTGPEKVGAHLNRILPHDTHAREASFCLPDPVNPDARGDQPRAANPPPSDVLREELALCEARLQKAGQSSLTATALYSEFFPLLESIEVQARELQFRVKQLALHRKAEDAFARLKELEADLRKRAEAGRQARELEKEVTELTAHIDKLPAIEDATLLRADTVAAEVDDYRRQFLETDQNKKQTQAHLSQTRSMRWWVVGLTGLIAIAVPQIIGATAPFVSYVLGSGVVLLAALPWAAMKTARRASLRRLQREYNEAWAEQRSTLELAEMNLIQVLRPYAARDVPHLKELASAQARHKSDLTDMQTKVTELQKVANTDDAIAIHSARESATVAEWQDQCRKLAPYRLDPAECENVVQRVRELEREARAQQQAASELKEQCETLHSGCSDITVQAEQVAEIKNRLMEWRRWEKAFRALHEVIDQLPEVADDRGDESVAAGYLNRISAARWTRLQYDAAASEYRVFDQEADLWIRADPQNPTVISSVNLACRLSLLESVSPSSLLPLWLVEPFDEMPETMAKATAGLLAEVALKRQVVLICRRLPGVQWPSDVAPQS